MPTIFSHAAVPLAARFGLGEEVISRRLLWAGVIVSVLPDLDVLAFRFGIPYADVFGHRGFTHSLLFAFSVAVVGVCLFRYLRVSPAVAFCFLFIVTASHGVLDSFTNGGLGVAFFWPWSSQRYFAPIQMIQVAPLNLERYFSSDGIVVILSELKWVWLPCILLTLTGVSIRYYMKNKP